MLPYFVLKLPRIVKTWIAETLSVPETASQFRVAPSLVLKAKVPVTSLKGKSHFAFNTHFRKKSVKIKSLVEKGAIPLDMFAYYSLSTLSVFIFTLPTSLNITTVC